MGKAEFNEEYKNKFLINEKTRMSIVKNILIEEIIPTLDFVDRLFIRTFRGKNDIHLIFEDEFKLREILKTISEIQDPGEGASPIKAALDEAITNFMGYPESKRIIILITDGDERDSASYIDTVDKLKILPGVPISIFVLGIAQDEIARTKSQKIETVGYFNIDSDSFSKQQLKHILSQLKLALLEKSIENVKPELNDFNVLINNNSEIINAGSSRVESIQGKIENIDTENRVIEINTLEELENEIRSQVSNPESLLSKINSLKEILRIGSLLETGINSTTFTIDSDYSESIRNRSESFLYEHLCQKYGETRVRWLNKDVESFSSHDFEILDDFHNIIHVVECKGTPQDKPTFYLTSHEWANFLNNKDIFQVYRVFNVESEMYCYCISNLLAEILSGRVVPYLLSPEILKERRVYLTIRWH
jgi:hypothetical protein